MEGIKSTKIVIMANLSNTLRLMTTRKFIRFGCVYHGFRDYGREPMERLLLIFIVYKCCCVASGNCLAGSGPIGHRRGDGIDRLSSKKMVCHQPRFGAIPYFLFAYHTNFCPFMLPFRCRWIFYFKLFTENIYIAGYYNILNVYTMDI